MALLKQRHLFVKFLEVCLDEGDVVFEVLLAFVFVVGVDDVLQSVEVRFQGKEFLLRFEDAVVGTGGVLKEFV